MLATDATWLRQQPAANDCRIVFSMIFKVRCLRRGQHTQAHGESRRELPERSELRSGGIRQAPKGGESLINDVILSEPEDLAEP
jgi:hypothetical protein